MPIAQIAEALLASTRDSVLELGSDWTITRIRDDGFGLFPEGAEGRNLWSVYPVEADSPRYRFLHDAMSKRKVHDFLDFHPQAHRWLAIQAVPHDDGLVVSFRDFSSHLQGGSLMEGWDLWRNVLDTLPVGIWLLDAGGHVVACNAEARSIWGGATPMDAADAASFAGWHHQNGRPISEWSSIRALRDGEPALDEEVDIQCKDGSRKTIRLSAVPLRDGNGQIQGAFALNRDVTREKADRLKLARAVKAAEHARTANAEVVAALAHDLMQPLLGVRLHLTCILPQVATDIEPTLRTAIASLLSAEHLVETLMESAALDSSSVATSRSVVDLGDVITQVCEETSATAWVRGLSLNHRIIRPAQVKTDQVLLQRCVRNLITNAIRYTNRGGVLVALRRRDGLPVIEVWDSGPGFEPAQLRRYLREGATGPSRASKGMGIGLKTVFRLVHLLGLELDARSAPGRGTLFRISFPLAAAPSTPRRSMHLARPRPAR